MEPRIPKAGADTVEETLEGYFRAADEPGQVVSKEEVAEEADVGEDVANRQKNFLASLGLLDKQGYDYLTTEDGIEVGKYLEFDRYERAYDKLEEVLIDWEPTDSLLDDIGDESVDEDDLFDKLEFATETLDARESSRKKAGINGLIEWYNRTGILYQNDGQWKVNDGFVTTQSDEVEAKSESSKQETGEVFEESDTVDNEQENQTQSTETSVEADTVQGGSNSDATVNLDITLDLSDESDPERVEKILSAVRKGLNGDSDQNVSGNDTDGGIADLTDFDD